MNQTDRITLLDSLRGYALMGLFLVHMVEYFELYWHNPEPNFWFSFTFAWFGGKAYAIFALLFGVSFHIIYSNYAKKDSMNVTNLFVRRMLFLLAFGVFHSIKLLPSSLARLSYLNPIFYMVNGIRGSMIGTSDVAPIVAGLVVGALALLSIIWCVRLFRRAHTIL